jgi:site-specific DNA-methyltransferase (cytosine-N4-specific)
VSAPDARIYRLMEPKPLIPSYTTEYGRMFCGRAEDVLQTPSIFDELKGRVQLILTSPPFPLNTKKKYGNLTGEKYLNWLVSFAPLLRQLVKPNGSIVIEIGNAWERGKPIMSTLPMEALLAFKKAGDFYLCQEFICHNPAGLPSPIQWVNVERCRVKDSFTRLWWLSTSEKPKASNSKVLVEYSKAMQALLRRQKYNAGGRPSEYRIGERSFLKSNGGAIPSNVLAIANTGSTDTYSSICRVKDLKRHPARMPGKLAEFFIRFLTDPSDLVLDPFAGSNTTGFVAEELERTWVSIETDDGYVEASTQRFFTEDAGSGEAASQ